MCWWHADVVEWLAVECRGYAALKASLLGSRYEKMPPCPFCGAVLACAGVRPCGPHGKQVKVEATYAWRDSSGEGT